MEFERVLPPQPLSDRTVLAPLAPLGRGTLHVESLSSYFMRLADRHDVSPKLLARELVLPILGLNARVGDVQADRYWRSSFFNGMGEVAANWCSALEELTGVSNLRGLTLLPLHGLVGMYGSASAIHRWCPLCLGESSASTIPYGQLLWEIGCVKACPTHGVRLLSDHGCTSEEAIPPLRVKPLPYLCRSCARPLAKASTDGSAAATRAEIEFAEAIGMVLAGPLFQGEPKPTSQSISAFLLNAVHSRDEGFGNRAVRRTGASKGEVSDWLSGKHLPSLPQAYTIARAYSFRLVDALIRNDEQIQVALPNRGKQRRITYSPFTRKERVWDEAYMEREILALLTPPSEAEAAAILGTSARELRRLHPKICALITQRRSVWRASEANRKREDRLKVVEELVNQMVSEGLIPTIARLEERLLDIPKAFLFKERPACKRLCIEGKARLGITT